MNISKNIKAQNKNKTVFIVLKMSYHNSRTERFFGVNCDIVLNWYIALIQGKLYLKFNISESFTTKCILIDGVWKKTLSCYKNIC